MDRWIVRSKVIATAAYCEANEVLEVEYYNGLVYQFSGVPIALGTDIFEQGQFDFMFNGIVGNYECALVERLPPIFLG